MKFFHQSIKILFLFCFFQATAQDTFTDSRDGQVYQIKTFQAPVGAGVILTHTWMVENLNYKMADANCFEEDESNCQKYGRLYTWEAAQKACPTGWHLSTDIEWQRLIHQTTDISENHYRYHDVKEVYQNLMESGRSGFEAKLGDFRFTHGVYSRQGKSGNYWTATEIDTNSVWYYLFAKNENKNGGGRVQRKKVNKTRGFSCRCVKD